MVVALEAVVFTRFEGYVVFGDRAVGVVIERFEDLEVFIVPT